MTKRLFELRDPPQSSSWLETQLMQHLQDSTLSCAVNQQNHLTQDWNGKHRSDRGEDKNLISLSSTEPIGGGVHVTMASD